MEWFVLVIVALLGMAMFVMGWFVLYVEKTTPEQRAKTGVMLPRDREILYDEEIRKEREFIRKSQQ